MLSEHGFSQKSFCFSPGGRERQNVGMITTDRDEGPVATVLEYEAASAALRYPTPKTGYGIVEIDSLAP